MICGFIEDLLPHEAIAYTVMFLLLGYTLLEVVCRQLSVHRMVPSLDNIVGLFIAGAGVKFFLDNINFAFPMLMIFMLGYWLGYKANHVAGLNLHIIKELCGEDLVFDYFLQDFKRQHRKDMSQNQRSLRRLRTACKCAKHTLSSSTQAHVEIDALFDGIDFNSTITRDRFVELCMDYLWKSMLTDFLTGKKSCKSINPNEDVSFGK